MTTKGPILLFDGECNLCDRMVSFIIRHDASRSIRFSSLQSETGKFLLGRYGISEGFSDTVVYIRGNKPFLRSSAVLNILKDLGGKWSLFYGFIIIPKFIRDFFYNIVASLRYKLFGKKAYC
ncbi:MAG: DUF393 domain-containing protein [Bacteroidales bacterium]|nr:DUF393 domain-containing protein [Bacteroidales bacterium]